MTPKKHKSVDLHLVIVDFEADILLKAVKAHGANAKSARTKNVCAGIARLLEHQIEEQTKED